jgi:hypothetical protein
MKNVADFFNWQKKSMSKSLKIFGLVQRLFLLTHKIRIFCPLLFHNRKKYLHHGNDKEISLHTSKFTSTTGYKNNELSLEIIQ